MSECISIMAASGEHRLEYFKSGDGGDYYVCMNANCGETLWQAVDCTGGR